MNILQSPRGRRLLRITAVLYLIILLTLTHWPRLGPLPEIPGRDQPLHVVAYFLAAVLVLSAFLRTGRGAAVFLFVLGLAVLGAADELTQPYVNRACDLGDWLADVAGIIAGTLLSLWLIVPQRRAVFQH